MCEVFGCCLGLCNGVCTLSFAVCVSSGRAGKVAWVTSYYVYTGHDMEHVHSVLCMCGVCVCVYVCAVLLRFVCKE